MAFELLSPLIFVLAWRWQRWAVAYFYSFHLVTISMITISFAPHLVAMLSFLPLEKAADWVARRLPPRDRSVAGSGLPVLLGEVAGHRVEADEGAAEGAGAGGH
jgi:hypothetical protein